jgi:hypothetical protein
VSWVAPTPQGGGPDDGKMASPVTGDFFHDDVMVVCMCVLSFIYCINLCTYLFILCFLFYIFINFIQFFSIYLFICIFIY